MKIVYTLFILLSGFIFLRCNGQKKTINANNSKYTCNYCDNLLGNYFIDYPYRQIDKNIEGVPLVKQSTKLLRKDSLFVLTTYEKKKIEENLFCFLGKSSDEIDKYFHPKYEQSEWPSEQIDKKLSLYYFNLGDYMIDRGSYFSPVEKAEKNKKVQFWLVGGDNFKLNFTKNEEQFIFTGRGVDSLRLKECLDKK